MVGVAQEPGKHLHLAGKEVALVGGQRIPGLHPARAICQRRAGGHHAELELTGERLVAPRFPPRVEAPAVAVGPLRRRLVRRVGSARREVQEERLAWRSLLLVLDVPDGAVGEVLGEVVAVGGSARRIDEVVVAHELGGPLVGIAGEEAVVALEPEAEGPALERTRRTLLPARGQVPLPDCERVVTGVAQDPRQRARRSRDASVVAGKPRRDVGEEAHADRVVVAAGQEARARRRAQRGDVEAVVPQPPLGELIDRGRGNARPEAAELREAEVVEHDHHDVGSSGRRPWGRREARLRLLDRPTDPAPCSHGVFLSASVRSC